SSGAMTGDTDAKGGGVLAQGADVNFTSAVVSQNVAQAANGSSGNNSSIDGLSAFGGGLYSTSGTITLTNSTFKLNKALGGDGTTGSNGANGSSGSNGTSGGNGGNAAGGGIYMESGDLNLDSSSVNSNTALAGAGGVGGNGGNATNPSGDGGN